MKWPSSVIKDFETLQNHPNLLINDLAFDNLPENFTVC